MKKYGYSYKNGGFLQFGGTKVSLKAVDNSTAYIEKNDTSEHGFGVTTYKDGNTASVEYDMEVIDDEHYRFSGIKSYWNDELVEPDDSSGKYGYSYQNGGLVSYGGAYDDGKQIDSIVLHTVQDDKNITETLTVSYSDENVLKFIGYAEHDENEDKTVLTSLETYWNDVLVEENENTGKYGYSLIAGGLLCFDGTYADSKPFDDITVEFTSDTHRVITQNFKDGCTAVMECDISSEYTDNTHEIILTNIKEYWNDELVRGGE